METAFIVIGVVAVVFTVAIYFLSGAFSKRMEDKNNELVAYEKIQRKNTEADIADTGSALDKRVRKKYGN